MENKVRCAWCEKDDLYRDYPVSYTHLDSLFFENIAGTIIEKKFFETENYKGYDIKNKTKSGNAQRYSCLLYTSRCV